MKKIVLIFIIIAFCNLSASDIEYYPNQNEYTRYSIIGGAGLNFNLHSADFSQLPGYENCCQNFSSAFGIGLDLFVGAEINFDQLVFGKPLSYNFSLRYSDLSATFNEEEFIGNYIEGNTAEQINVNNNLDATLPVFNTQHSFMLSFKMDEGFLSKLRPDKTSHFQFGLGFNVGFPMGNEFSQQEELLSPGYLNFENGSKYRNQAEGDIPEATSLHFSLFPKLRFNYLSRKNLTFFQDVQYNYALTDVSSAVDWAAHGFATSVGLKYRLPKAKKPEIIPQDPPKSLIPAPEKPIPVVPDTLLVDLEVRINGQEVQKGGEVYYTSEYEENVEVNYLPARYYYEKSETDYQFTPYFSKNVRTGSTLIFSSADEDIETLIERKENYFRYNNLSEDDYKVEFITDGLAERLNNPSVKKHPELYDEYRYLSVKGVETIDSEISIEKELIRSETLMVRLNADVNTNNSIHKEEMVVLNQGVELSSANANYFEFRLNDNIDLDEKRAFEIRYSVTDAKGNKESNSLNFYTVPVEKIIRREHKVVNSNIKSNGDLFLLALFKYDTNEFEYVQEDVLSKVKEAIAMGKNIKLIASTDYLGEVDYNKALAERRGKKAADYLNLQENEYVLSINTHNSGSYSIVERILQRSVYILIE